jgi:aryl carrier-like protein
MTTEHKALTKAFIQSGRYAILGVKPDKMTDLQTDLIDHGYESSRLIPVHGRWKGKSEVSLLILNHENPIELKDIGHSYGEQTLLTAVSGWGIIHDLEDWLLTSHSAEIEVVAERCIPKEWESYTIWNELAFRWRF